jgi:hypothetical protein
VRAQVVKPALLADALVLHKVQKWILAGASMFLKETAQVPRYDNRKFYS